MRRLAWLCIAPLAACNGGTDAGNPVADMEVTLYSEAPGVTIGEAWLAAGGVSLHAPADCAGSPVVDVQGPLVVDLLSDQPPAALVGLTFEPGAYCRLALTWGLGAAGDPADLVGASLSIRGTRADGTPFLLRTTRAGAVGFGDAASEFQLAGTLTTLFIGFDLAAMFAPVDLAGATVGGDGVIHIETGMNDTQLAAFEAALHASSHLFDDADHDGHLDPEEHMPGHEIATGH